MSNLPANIENMVTGLVQSVQTVGTGGGDLFMKMGKNGIFVYGQEDIETEEDATWAANPAGFQHGWIAWGDKAHGTESKMLGEKLGPAAQPIFDESELPSVEGTWSQAIAIQFRCMDGEDEGTQCLYKANSHGGRKAYGELLKKIIEKIQSGDNELVPVVRLASTSYKHEKYGKIFNPDFIVTGWLAMDAVPEGEPPEEEAPEEEAPPKRKRGKKAAKVAPEPEEAAEGELVEEEEEAEPEPKPRRRRRKAA